MTDTNKQGIKISVITACLGWIVTFGSAVAYISQKDATFSARLQFMEKDIVSLDSRARYERNFSCNTYDRSCRNKNRFVMDKKVFNR